MTETCTTEGHTDRPAVEKKILMGTEFRRCQQCADEGAKLAAQAKRDARRRSRQSFAAYGRALESYRRY